jgi:hypothetical protein
MSLEMAHKVIVPSKKNYVAKFLKQQDIGNFMYQSADVYCCCVLLSVVACSFVLLCVAACKMGLLVAVCEQVLRVGGMVGCYSRAPPPPHHYSLGIHACMLVGGGCYSYIRSDPSLELV